MTKDLILIRKLGNKVKLVLIESTKDLPDPLAPFTVAVYHKWLKLPIGSDLGTFEELDDCKTTTFMAESERHAFHESLLMLGLNTRRAQYPGTILEFESLREAIREYPNRASYMLFYLVFEE